MMMPMAEMIAVEVVIALLSVALLGSYPINN